MVPLPLPEDADARTRKVYDTFVVDGRIPTLPAKLGKRLVLLDLVAQLFEPGVKYDELAVNRILVEICQDYVALRRYLVDHEFLDRENGVYWRAGGTFGP